MTEEKVERPSAQIYQFPKRGRFVRDDSTTPSKPARLVRTVGGAWYHDEAIAEAEERNK